MNNYGRISNAVLWLLIFTFIAKLLALARDILIAASYGRGPEVDAYYLAYTIATWMPLTFYSIATVVIVPTLVKLRTESQQLKQKFYAELSGMALFLGAVMSILLWTGSPLIISFMTSNLPKGTRLVTTEILSTFYALPLIGTLSAIYSVYLQAKNNHSYSIVEGVVPMMTIISIYLMQGARTTPLVAGANLGTVLQALILFCLVKKYVQVGFIFNMPKFSGIWSDMWRDFSAVGLGSLVMGLAVLIDQYFAAKLGSGSIATYSYANKILSIGMTFAATIVTRSTLTFFSELSTKTTNLRSTVLIAYKICLSILLISILFTALLMLFTYQITSLIYQRGVFTASDTLAVSQAINWGIWQLPFFLSALVLVSFIASQAKFWILSIIAVIAVIVKLLINFIFDDIIGINAIFLSNIVMYGVNLLMSIYFLKRYLRK
jgi:putative peptidoglycan lipid II flippase